MKHLDEHILEQYVLEDPGVNSLRGPVQQHLEGCDGCFALYREILEYHEEVDRLERSHHQALILTHALAIRKGERRSLRPLGKGPLARAIDTLRRHPIRASVAGVAFCGLLLMIFLRTQEIDNPSYARARNEFLVVYNEDGKELWKKHVSLAYDDREPFGISEYPSGFTAARVYDVDNDGKNEILCFLGPRVGDLSKDIVCYRGDGTERWRYSVRKSITFGATKFSDDYVVNYITVGDFDNNGTVEVIGYAAHRTYFPAVVFRLRATDGLLEEEYSHCGWFHSVCRIDLDGDGVEEFLFGGQNNSYDFASMVALDPRFLQGKGPTAAGFESAGSAGKEVAYLLFLKTQLGEMARKPRNFVNTLTLSGNEIQVEILEFLYDRMDISTHLYLDKNLRCLRAGKSDDFAASYQKLKSSGKKLKPLEEMYNDFLKCVRYWNGENFVDYPVIREVPALTP